MKLEALLGTLLMYEEVSVFENGDELFNGLNKDAVNDIKYIGDLHVDKFYLNNGLVIIEVTRIYNTITLKEVLNCLWGKKVVVTMEDEVVEDVQNYLDSIVCKISHIDGESIIKILVD